MAQDEVAIAAAATMIRTVVSTALEARRPAILHHAAVYAEATGNPGPHVQEAAVRKMVREGTEFFLNKLFGTEAMQGS